MTEAEEKKIMELAKRVLNLVDPWDREPDKTEEEQITDTFNTITTEPEYIVEFLLDIIDNYTA